MTIYIGTSTVKIKPMSLHEWYSLPRISGELPEKTGDNEEGFLLTHILNHDPNIVGYDNKLTWINKEKFERCYYPSGQFSMYMAMTMLDLGYMITNEIFRNDGYRGVIKDKTHDAYLIDNDGNKYRWVPDIPCLRYQYWEVIDEIIDRDALLK